MNRWSRRTANILTALIPHRKTRRAVRSYIKTFLFHHDFSPTKKLDCFFVNKKLDYFEKRYPRVLSIKETLNEIISKKLSIARFGDGEYSICLGGKIYFQKYTPQLQVKLCEILKSDNPHCLIAICPFIKPDKFSSLNISNYTWAEIYWLKLPKKILNFLIKEKVYANALLSRINFFAECSLEDIKQIWDKRKVVFVIGRNSHFKLDDRVFGNISEKHFVYGSRRDSFNTYDEILKEIKKYPKEEFMIILSLGPTASILAYELSLDGYQAIDLGHFVNCYHKYLGEHEEPEIEYKHLQHLY